MIIKKIKAKEINDSRQIKTIKVEVDTSNGKFDAAAPSGTSTSGKAVRPFSQKGIKYSVGFVNEILNKKLKDFEFEDFNDFRKIEDLVKRYDNSDNLEKVGGNAIIALEFALLKAVSKNKGWKFLNPKSKQIPRPLGNCIGGGKHVRKVSPDFQEFLLISFNAKSFLDAVKANQKIYDLASKEIKLWDSKFDDEITSEGAWAPNLTNIEVLNILDKLTKEVSKEVGFEVRIGIDVAADSFYKDGYYNYKNFDIKEKQKKLSKKDHIDFLVKLVNKYRIAYLEDPLQENDLAGFAILNKKLKNKCLVCGDDLIATNPDILKKAIKQKSISAVIVKPNQIGSIVKVKEVIDVAKKNKIHPVISHRSGETLDASISHLAVGLNCPIIKCGIVGKERSAKIEEIKKIEHQIRNK